MVCPSARSGRRSVGEGVPVAGATTRTSRPAARQSGQAHWHHERRSVARAGRCGRLAALATLAPTDGNAACRGETATCSPTGSLWVETMLLPSRRAVKEGAWVPGGGFHPGATDLARWATQSGPMWAGLARVPQWRASGRGGRGDDPQSAATVGTGENIEIEHAAHQRGPGPRVRGTGGAGVGLERARVGVRGGAAGAGDLRAPAPCGARRKGGILCSYRHGWSLLLSYLSHGSSVGLHSTSRAA
jgi:hypothetical protein